MHAFITQDSIRQLPDKSQSSIDTLEINPDTSIGIEEVRQIKHFLSRKPMQSAGNTVIIHRAHLLTLPAQNALLKTLEEPPGNSLIYLVTQYPDQLLPTVLSRVQIIPAPHKSYESYKSYKSNFLDKLLAAGVGERLLLIEAQAFTRETALEFLDNLEWLIHQDLSLARLHPQVVETRKYLKANCNVKLSLDYLVMSL